MKVNVAMLKEVKHYWCESHGNAIHEKGWEEYNEEMEQGNNEKVNDGIKSNNKIDMNTN